MISMLRPWVINSLVALWEKRADLPECFDFPNYGNVPRRFSRYLSPDFVDAVQSIWPELRSGEFRRFNDFMLAVLKSPDWSPI